jgi:hypothetical protein
MKFMRAGLAFFVLGVVAGICVAGTAQQGDPACGLSAASLKGVVPKSAVDIECASVPGYGSQYLVAWTTRDADSSPTSHVRLIEIEANSVQILQRRRMVFGYRSMFEHTQRFENAMGPIWVMTIQFGVAEQELGILTLTSGKIHLNWLIAGDYLEYMPARSGNDIVVAHSAISGIDAPNLFQLRAGRFVNVSRRRPDYYRGLLAKQHLSADGSSVSPSLYPQLARLLGLSGDAEGAKRLLARTRNSE